MKCFMRGNSNPHEEVPNCVGEGVPEADYCYEANEALTLEAPVELETRVAECGRRGKVCMQCQGGTCSACCCVLLNLEPRQFRPEDGSAH